jgi:hypothetical protein
MANNNLIILDWDDTLFPTSRFIENKLNKSELKSIEIKLIAFFNKINKLGRIFIVTNASNSWIDTSLNNLPKFKKIIDRSSIISAREKVSRYVDSPFLWKLSIFKNLVKNKKFKSIISIGDAEYESRALASLHNNDDKKYLKVIRCMKNPNLDILSKQLVLLTKNIENIIKQKKHIDKSFEINNE